MSEVEAIPQVPTEIVDLLKKFLALLNDIDWAAGWVYHWMTEAQINTGYFPDHWAKHAIRNEIRNADSYLRVIWDRQTQMECEIRRLLSRLERGGDRHE